MRIRRTPITVVVLSAAMLCLAAVSPLVAQTVAGKLLEAFTNKPIAAADVTLVSTQSAPVARAKSGNDGTFLVTAPGPGVYRVRAEKAGYRTVVSPAVELRAGDQILFVWRMTPDTVHLQAVSVTATGRKTGLLSGFAQRLQRHTAGHFIARDQIEKEHPLYVSDLLSRVPGLVAEPSPTGFGNVVRTTEGCVPDVFLDGLRYPLHGETIDQIVNPTELEGIEVYPHAAEVPAEFHSANATCGAIVLWTRVGP
jgi:hypothetical protein